MREKQVEYKRKRRKNKTKRFPQNLLFLDVTTAKIKGPLTEKRNIPKLACTRTN